MAGPFGQEKRLELVTRNFHWERLTERINDYVRSCDECQENKSPRNAKYGLLQPLEVPYAAWTSIAVDFITQLPESHGQTQIMVVGDRYTKIAHFIGLAKARPQMMSRIPSLRKFGNFMDCPAKSSRIWTQSFEANFGKHCAKH